MIPLVVFYEKDHRYVRTSDGKVLTSSTTVVGKYHFFDREFWLIYKVGELVLAPEIFQWLKVNFLDRDKERMKREIIQRVGWHTIRYYQDMIGESWDLNSEQSLQKGSYYHGYRENEAVELGRIRNPKDNLVYLTYTKPKLEYDNYFYTHWKADHFYPERLLYWKDYCGTVDKTFAKAWNKVDVGDYKTSKTIEKTSYKSQRMLEPLNHLEDCNYNHYSLQLSIYAYMLEKLFGVEVDNLYIDHKPDLDSRYRRYIDVPYLKKEVEMILV